MITETKAWKDLEKNYKEVKDLHLRDLFAKDPIERLYDAPRAVDSRFSRCYPKIKTDYLDSLLV